MNRLKLGALVAGSGLVLAVLVGLAVWWQQSAARPRGDDPAVLVNLLDGPLVDTGSLRDLQGSLRSIEPWRGQRATVLVFLGVDCPLANQFLPHLKRLEARYRPAGATFVAVYPNEHESIDRVAGHAADFDIPFLVLKDNQQQLCDALGVTRTPEVCVLDWELALRYRGRIDDRYGVNYRRDAPRREDLVLALDDVLAGRRVEVATTPVDGCLVDRGRKSAGGASARDDGAPAAPRAAADAAGDAAVHPAADVVADPAAAAAILARRCQECHRPGQPGPFSLVTYDDAVRWSDMIREVVVQRRMPPWHADPRFGLFRNDRRLSDDEIDALVTWIDQGTPQGDWPESRLAAATGETAAALEAAATDETAAALEAAATDETAATGEAGATGETGEPLEPARPATDEVSSTPDQGTTAADAPPWHLGRPDVVLRTPEEIEVPAEGVLDYLYITLPEEQSKEWFGIERWVTASELRPTSPAVVHHMTVFVVAPGGTPPPGSFGDSSILAAWAPGELPFVFPEGAALRVQAGSTLVFEIHYTPNGRATTDRPELALRFAAEPPDREMRLVTHDHVNLRLPPGEPNYRAEVLSTFTAPAEMLGLYPHMHLRGKRFSFTAIYPDGHEQVLLSVPRFDFNWQNIYWFEQPLPMPKGTQIRAVAHWDNSIHNPSNPDPSVEVRTGAQSTDEMMVGWMFFVTQRSDEPRNPNEVLIVDAGSRAEVAVEQWATAVEENPADVEARTELAIALVWAGDLARAEQEFLEVLRSDSPPLRAQRSLGELYLQHNRPQQARPYLAAALERAPDDIALRRSLAIALARLEQTDEAIAELERVLAAAPRDGLAHYELARVLAGRGDTEGAHEHFRQALSVDPQFAPAHYALGMSLANQNRLAAAATHFREACRIEPRVAEYHFYLGVTLAETDRLREALDCYRTALELQPDHAAAANNLAWILATHPDDSIRNGSEAVVLAERICGPQQSPPPELLDTLAAAYAEAGRWADAARVVDEALAAVDFRQQPALATALELRRQRYRDRQAYRDTSLPPAT